MAEALTPRMQRTIERAAVIARENGQAVVGTEHVLLAFLEDRSGIAGGTLHRLGFADAVRSEVVWIITSDGYRTPSSRMVTDESSSIRER